MHVLVVDVGGRRPDGRDNANAFAGGELLWKKSLVKRGAARASTTQAQPAKT